MSESASRLASLLDELEAELVRVGVSEVIAPPAAALESVLPFSADTLRFTQWLQWVFIPHTRALLEAGGELPARSGIRPMAEEALAGCDWDPTALIEVTGRIDQVINAGPQTNVS